VSRAGWERHRGPATAGLVLLIVGVAFALSINVPTTGYGIKSDEATYVAAALSVAYDHDLNFDRGDLQRFATFYHGGPEGIFLKRGHGLRFRLTRRPPFALLVRQYDPSLYFAKALLYPVVAAPFVRLFGLNGMLLLNVLLLAMIVALGYLFLAVQGSTVSALIWTTAFAGASVVPAYAVFLMPEVLNAALVFAAYFLFLFKETAVARRLSHQWTDVAAAILLGLATYSKPLPTAVFVAPLVALQFWRNRVAWGLTVGAAAVAAAVVCFAANAVVTGELNYQGGDRKTFYNHFPFESTDATFDRLGTVVQTDGGEAQKVLSSSDTATWFSNNLVYFAAGRHFGLVPYFFPAVAAMVLWLLSPSRRDAWRALLFCAFLVSVVVLLVVLPFTWSGGGGPPGNRYFFAVYPALLFLTPPLAGASTGIMAWLGGSLFTVQILATPFASAKNTWLLTERGPSRWLPVELPMANDLPVMRTESRRGRVHYGPNDENGFLLYFLDGSSWPPEPEWMWVSGYGRTEIIVRTVKPIRHLAVEMQSPIPTTVTVAIGAPSATVTLEPNKVQRIEIPANGVRGLNSYAYLLTAKSTNGFVPHLIDSKNGDYRYLGAQLHFSMRP
jgi:hypothetical protein